MAGVAAVSSGISLVVAATGQSTLRALNDLLTNSVGTLAAWGAALVPFNSHERPMED